MEPLSGFEIFTGVIARFWIVWISMVLIFAISIKTKRKTALYGKLFDSPIGMVGFALVLFWVLTALFAYLIMTHDPLGQVSGMKNKVPGTPLRGATVDEYQWYLLGGDHLARDVFSRVIAGSRIVLKIAPLATLFAFMVGITLGLPAGYFGKRIDTILSFLANMILAFPVILLFYLLVTPEIIATGLPLFLAGVMFLIPIVFMILLWQSRFKLAHCFSYCAGSGDGHPNTRLCGRRANPWRRAVVYHVVGNSAQRTWPADRRFLFADWVYNHPLGNLGFLWSGVGIRKP